MFAKLKYLKAVWRLMNKGRNAKNISRITRYKIRVMNSIGNKVLTAMGVVMLICFLTIGFFAFPVGILICAIIGLTYGLKYKEKKFTLFSSVTLVIGIGCVIYTLLLIESM